MSSITTSAASSIPAVVIVIAAFAIVSSVLAVAVNSINAFVAFAPPLRLRHYRHQHHHLHTSSWALLQRKRHRRQCSFPSPLENIATRSSITSSSSLENSSTDGADADAEQRQQQQERIIMWDAQSQTYLNGIVPSHHDSSSDIDTLLSLNGDGKLKIFGYGSLCWHAGSEGGVLSLADREEEEEYYEEHEHHLIQDNVTSTTSPSISTTKRKGRVSTSPGMAIGYQRCWSQRSADHRGTPQFNGIVCTLLSDEEVERLQYDEEDTIVKQEQHQQQPNRLHSLQPNSSTGASSKRRKEASMTEGLIYTIDEDLVHECLAELDFREKGVSHHYLSDVISTLVYVLIPNYTITS